MYVTEDFLLAVDLQDTCRAFASEASGRQKYDLYMKVGGADESADITVHLSLSVGLVLL